MVISRTKEFGVYHWDTFDDETLLIYQSDSLEDAKRFVFERYRGRIGGNGADQVDIVNSRGDVLKTYLVG